MRGRKPVPTALKQLRGTVRQDRILKNEPKFDIPGKMLVPPNDLPEEGQDLWRSLGKVLLDAGLMTYGDKLALELLCLAYARMKKANRNVLIDGEVLVSDNGGYYQNPWLSVANRAWDQVKGMLGEFGLTPAERTRVMAAVEQEEDDLADLLFRPVPVKDQLDE